MQQIFLSNDNVSRGWSRVKQNYRELFWEETHSNIRQLIKEKLEYTLELETTEILGAKKHERTECRKGYRDGKRTRGLESIYGYIESITVPRVANMKIDFQVLRKYKRHQEEFEEMLLEYYLAGVSSRKLESIVYKMYGNVVSHSKICSLIKNLEQKIKEYRTKKLEDKYKYLIVDGLYVKVKDITIEEKIVIIVLGVDHAGNKEILGFRLVRTESEESVKCLLEDLKIRGVKSPELIIHDGSKGIIGAINLVYSYADTQLCAFHKLKNIDDNLKTKKHRKKIMAEAARIYNEAVTPQDALYKLKLFKKKWYNIEPKAVRCFIKDFEKTLTYFKYPESHWRLIRTTNHLERINRSIREFTSKFKYFQSESSVTRVFYCFIDKYNDLNYTFEGMKLRLKKIA
jgi:transposase-like protein